MFYFLGRLINAISQVKQLIVTRTTADSFPNESQELTKVSEKISKNATSMYMILYGYAWLYLLKFINFFIININLIIFSCLYILYILLHILLILYFK